jgi:hypothetical protein
MPGVGRWLLIAVGRWPLGAGRSGVPGADRSPVMGLGRSGVPGAGRSGVPRARRWPLAAGRSRSVLGAGRSSALGLGRSPLPGAGRWPPGAGRTGVPGVGRWPPGVGRSMLGTGRWSLMVGRSLVPGAGRWPLAAGRSRSVLTAGRFLAVGAGRFPALGLDRRAPLRPRWPRLELADRFRAGAGASPRVGAGVLGWCNRFSTSRTSGISRARRSRSRICLCVLAVPRSSTTPSTTPIVTRPLGVSAGRNSSVSTFAFRVASFMSGFGSPLLPTRRCICSRVKLAPHHASRVPSRTASR